MKRLTSEWKSKLSLNKERGSIKNWTLVFLLVMFVISGGGHKAAGQSAKGLAAGATQSSRPNFLIIITDDQSHARQTLDRRFMPNTRSMIIDQGVLFTQGFVTTPLCAPSRSSIFTGKYGRHHGVLTNGGPLLSETTLYDRLHEAGYYTGLVGKYLNQFTMQHPLPNFHFVAVHAGGGSRYFNPRLNINGRWQDVEGYITHLLRDQALRFLSQVPDDQPFLLFFTPNAPHAAATPAPGDEDLYRDLPPFRPPNFNPIDNSDKPNWLQNRPRLTPAQIRNNVDNFRIRQLQTLKPVDEAIGDMLSLLSKQRKLDNTMVVFISDNGYFWGEHRLTGKNRVYEPAVRVPFALRYPPLVHGPKVERRLVANIDIAPTIYELAGILPIPADVDGLSLVPLLRGTQRWRDALLLEGRPNPPFQATRTKRYVCVETQRDRPELYDLKIDRYQLRNLVDDPDYADIVKQLREQLAQF